MYSVFVNITHNLKLAEIDPVTDLEYVIGHQFTHMPIKQWILLTPPMQVPFSTFLP